MPWGTPRMKSQTRFSGLSQMNSTNTTVGMAVRLMLKAVTAGIAVLASGLALASCTTADAEQPTTNLESHLNDEVLGLAPSNAWVEVPKLEHFSSATLWDADDEAGTALVSVPVGLKDRETWTGSHPYAQDSICGFLRVKDLPDEYSLHSVLLDVSDFAADTVLKAPVAHDTVSLTCESVNTGFDVLDKSVEPVFSYIESKHGYKEALIEVPASDVIVIEGGDHE